MDADKAYRFTIAWGRTTATFDREGEVTADLRRAPDARRGRGRRCRPSSARSSQVPPAYSAIKVDGERAYDLARAGETVELAAAHRDDPFGRAWPTRRTPTTSRSRSTAARAPMSAPSSATWPTRWAPAAMSATCAAPASGRFTRGRRDDAGNAGGFGA